MSERKTAEIKFRCTPSFKAAVQAQAEAEGISASQLIENAANLHLWAEANKKIDGTALVDHAIKTLRELPAEPVGGGFLLKVGDIVREDSAALGSCRGEGMEDVALCPPCIEAGGCKLPVQGAPIRPGLQPADTPADDAAPCGCRPWEFCACKANA